MAKPTARLPRKWTVGEDQTLREEVEAQTLTSIVVEGEVKDWCRIAAKLPGRTNKDCRKRWFNSVAGGLKKGQWAKSEDLQLTMGVQRYGQRWTQVAEIVGSRSADQCAKRWQQSLDPDLDRSEWRDHEDKVLIKAVQQLGRHWKDIQHHHFPGRSKNCIKNRYTVLLRRYQNQGINPFSDGEEPGEPSTSSGYDVGPFPGADDDNRSYTSSLYDDPLYSSTQVSTPETHSSWIDEESFTPWPNHESFAVPSSNSNSTALQQPHLNVATSSQWSWADSPITVVTAPMDSPPMMNIDPNPSYPGVTSAYYVPTPPTISPYCSYGAAQTILAPTSAPSSRRDNRSSFPGSLAAVSNRSSARHSAALSAPTSARNSAAYHDLEAVARYMKYGTQRDASYRML
ncbi:hypothetical protein K469DRAFT_796062 [Zopfia rhizophila CBS 207.26]|uniref:Uncharacterized protein n=1 Tax=Zopfia rhizophila CBS 207.26 TaxID=1314779 RepID=A0A6A6ET10_9PEZI|nr:hypothetical protein K469DRAFT_796062 [Zopfia rhizophila CBS 207.26]